jgi:hypothetical protein
VNVQPGNLKPATSCFRTSGNKKRAKLTEHRKFIQWQDKHEGGRLGENGRAVPIRAPCRNRRWVW